MLVRIANQGCIKSIVWLLVVRDNTNRCALFFFSDNTYVSNSENNDDVLVTRDPIPVIFHRIATGKAFLILQTYIPRLMFLSSLVQFC